MYKFPHLTAQCCVIVVLNKFSDIVAFYVVKVEASSALEVAFEALAARAREQGVIIDTLFCDDLRFQKIAKRILCCSVLQDIFHIIHRMTSRLTSTGEADYAQVFKELHNVFYDKNYLPSFQMVKRFLGDHPGVSPDKVVKQINSGKGDFIAVCTHLCKTLKNGFTLEIYEKAMDRHYKQFIRQKPASRLYQINAMKNHIEKCTGILNATSQTSISKNYIMACKEQLCTYIESGKCCFQSHWTDDELFYKVGEQ